MRALARVAVLMLAAPLAVQAGPCGRFPSPGFEDADMPRTEEGHYANGQYGYRVGLPAGLVGHRPAEPAPNHGLGIVLSWTPRAYLYADGTYEVLEDDTLAKQAARLRGYTHQDAHRVLSSRSTKAKLGPLRAVRLVSRYECRGLSGLYITDEVVALSEDRRIVYTVALLTTARRYRQDKPAFEAMVRSFTLMKTSWPTSSP